MKKTGDRKSRWTVPLKGQFYEQNRLFLSMWGGVFCSVIGQ